jgi:hypothetical protein
MGAPSAPNNLPLYTAHDDMAPYRTLALAVITRALQDARHQPPALAWLRRSEELRFWCEVANLDVDDLRRRLPRVNLRRLAAGRPPAPLQGALRTPSA